MLSMECVHLYFFLFGYSHLVDQVSSVGPLIVSLHPSAFEQELNLRKIFLKEVLVSKV